MTMEKAFERYMNEVRTTQRLSELQEKELCERIKKGEAAAVEALVKPTSSLWWPLPTVSAEKGWSWKIW